MCFVLLPRTTGAAPGLAIQKRRLVHQAAQELIAVNGGRYRCPTLRPGLFRVGDPAPATKPYPFPFGLGVSQSDDELDGRPDRNTRFADDEVGA